MMIKLIVALGLNVVLLAVLLPWLRCEWRTAPRPLQRILLPALGLRLLVGGLSSRHLINDALIMSGLGKALTRLLWADPGSAVRHLLGDTFQLEGWDVVHHGQSTNLLITSNSFFFSKLLMFLNLASGSTDWLNGLYLSLFAFVGSWLLARMLARLFPTIPAGAGAIALLLWPSVVGFASGITKEALLLGSATWLVALVLQKLYAEPAGSVSQPTPRWRGLAGWLGIVLLAVLHVKSRYFFAFPLLGVLAGLAFIRVLQKLGLARRRWVQVALLLGVLAVGGWLGTQLSPVLTLNRFTAELMKIYSRHLEYSAGKPHFEYPDLRPTGESALRHVPIAIWNTLSRPWLGESWAPAYIIGALENLALLSLLALAGWAALRRRAGHLPFALVLALALHCLLLAVLIGLSTPNLGSLHRYRSGLMPFLVLLLLQNDYVATLLRRAGLGNVLQPAFDASQPAAAEPAAKAAVPLSN